MQKMSSSLRGEALAARYSDNWQEHGAHSYLYDLR